MRTRSAILAAAALVGAAVSAFAGAQGEPDQDCGASTPEMVECLNVKTAEWDKRLNAAYAKALKEVETKQRESLRAAQRLWVQYRDANCLYYSLGEGSIARVEAAGCMLRMTKARALELEGKEDRD
ncbi:MAG TPA: lysozyme inhibitor LprI family protein [Pseudolabrys sp.]|nr:lysozyme inhibitor LprI family protein [Pseudolabrys sp.]